MSARKQTLGLLSLSKERMKEWGRNGKGIKREVMREREEKRKIIEKRRTTTRVKDMSNAELISCLQVSNQRLLPNFLVLVL